MLEAFQIAIEDTPLFCKTCQGVFLHTLKARTVLRPGTPAPPQEPILILCHQCRKAQIFVAGEFRNYSPPAPQGLLYKIPGRSRLQVKDSVYLPGQPCPGVVKSRFRSELSEIYVITLQTGTEIYWSSQGLQQYAENALEGHRLIPLDLNQTRIGDLIYHTLRDKVGRAIGLLHGKESKLVIQLEDGVLLLITLGASRQIPENRELVLQAEKQLSWLDAAVGNHIKIDAGQGILYAHGNCSSLPAAQHIRASLASIPNLRGLVDQLNIQPMEIVTDSALAEHMMEQLLRKDLPVFGVRVDCHEGCASIQGFCRHENTNAELGALLEVIPGLRGLQLDLKFRPECGEDEKRIHAVAQALQGNSTLNHARIRIYSQRGIIHLEGIVRTSMQRNAAALTAVWAGRNFKICNDINIRKDSENSTAFIKVA